jgi:hypothetical protein
LLAETFENFYYNINNKNINNNNNNTQKIENSTNNNNKNNNNFEFLKNDQEETIAEIAMKSKNFYKNLALKRNKFPRPYAITNLPHRFIIFFIIFFIFLLLHLFLLLLCFLIYNTIKL